MNPINNYYFQFLHNVALRDVYIKTNYIRQKLILTKKTKNHEFYKKKKCINTALRYRIHDILNKKL